MNITQNGGKMTQNKIEVKDLVIWFLRAVLTTISGITAFLIIEVYRDFKTVSSSINELKNIQGIHEIRIQALEQKDRKDIDLNY